MYLIQISVGTFNSIIFIFIHSSWDRARTDKSTWDRAKNFGWKLSLWSNYACVDWPAIPPHCLSQLAVCMQRRWIIKITSKLSVPWSGSFVSNASFIFFLFSAFVSSSSPFTIPPERVNESLFNPGGGSTYIVKWCVCLSYFLGYKILSLVFFRVFWKIFCRNEILVVLGSAHFPYRVKTSFQKFFGNIGTF